jgi:hypothetical protein
MIDRQYMASLQLCPSVVMSRRQQDDCHLPGARVGTGNWDRRPSRAVPRPDSCTDKHPITCFDILHGHVRQTASHRSAPPALGSLIKLCPSAGAPSIAQRPRPSPDPGARETGQTRETRHPRGPNGRAISAAHPRSKAACPSSLSGLVIDCASSPTSDSRQHRLIWDGYSHFYPMLTESPFLPSPPQP